MKNAGIFQPAFFKIKYNILFSIIVIYFDFRDGFITNVIISGNDYLSAVIINKFYKLLYRIDF